MSNSASAVKRRPGVQERIRKLKYELQTEQQQTVLRERRRTCSVDSQDKTGKDQNNKCGTIRKEAAESAKTTEDEKVVPISSK